MGVMLNLKRNLLTLKVPELPKMLYIETTNKCNLRCVMCPRSVMKRKPGSIKFGFYKKIVDKASKEGIKWIRLHGFGEPLLHPDLVKMIEYAKRKHIQKVDFSTNAMLLNESLAEKIIRAGLDEIQISMDGVTRETYEKIRVGAKWDTVIKNVKNFIALRNKINSKLRIKLQMIKDMSETYSEAKEFRRMWERKVDEVSLTSLSSLPTKKVKRIRGKRSCAGIIPPTCTQPWMTLYIAYNGDVTPCCDDVNLDLKIGNIKNSSIHDLWHSENINEIREIFRKREFQKLKPCRTCYILRGG